MLFLYNSTISSHIEFLHDVRVANWRHDVRFFKQDCTERRELCAYFGHGETHAYDPPLLFFHKGEWSESFHDEIQLGEHPSPASRRQRVKAMVRWIDRAAPRAATKLHDRGTQAAGSNPRAAGASHGGRPRRFRLSLSLPASPSALPRPSAGRACRRAAARRRAPPRCAEMMMMNMKHEESPTQRMMREMHEKAEKEKKAAGGQEGQEEQQGQEQEGPKVEL